MIKRETELYPVRTSKVWENPSQIPATSPTVYTPESREPPAVVPLQMPDMVAGLWRSKGTDMRIPVRSCLIAASIGPGLPHSTPLMVTYQRMQHLVQLSTARFPFHVTLMLELEWCFSKEQFMIVALTAGELSVATLQCSQFG